MRLHINVKENFISERTDSGLFYNGLHYLENKPLQLRNVPFLILKITDLYCIYLKHMKNNLT